MSEQVRVIDAIEKIPQDTWRELTNGYPALRYEVLEAIANHAAEFLPQRIFLLEDETGLAGAAICEMVSGAARSSLDAQLFGRALKFIRKLGISTRPSLSFRLPLGTGSPIVLRRSDDSQRLHWARRLLHEIEGYATAHRLGVAFIGIPADDEVLIRLFREHAYLDTELQPTAKLEVEWQDFDGYLKQLRKNSKTAADTVRNERNRNRRNGVHIRLVPHDRVDADRVYAFAKNHYRYKNGREPFDGPGFLPQLRGRLAEDFLSFQAERDEQPIASVVIVRSGSVGWVSWLGFQELDRPNDFTYANLCFYQPAECAPALGLKTLLYGNGALTAKQRRGCTLTGTRLFYRPRKGWSRFALRPYFSVHRSWYRRKLR